MINFVDKNMFGKGKKIFLYKTIVLGFYYVSPDFDTIFYANL